MAGQDALDEVPFGRYRLVELLGRGGMGEVWRAYDTATNNRTVAIKLLPPHLASDSTFVQRFRREADAAGRLNNPHIIPIHTYGEIDGRLFVDMRLVEGRDLQAVLADGPLEAGRAVRIIEQVAKALQAAHKIGLVHRDVKPSNILLDEDDFAYLIDFGIARGADETGLTSTGAMIGSWHYMAPERLRARAANARADIYALACVLYECLTGHRPFPGDSLESQVAAHLTDPPPQPSTTQPNVPAQFDAVIAKGMAKEPDNRYASTVELADAARDAITIPIQRSTPSPAPNPPTEQAVPVTARGVPYISYDEPPQPPPSRNDPTFAAAALEQRDNTIAHQPTQLAPTQPAGAPKIASPSAITAASSFWLTRRGWAVVLVAAAIVAIVAVVLVTSQTNGSPSQKTGSPSPTAAPPTLPSPPTPSQVELPFTGLNRPGAVAVDSAGGVYVADSDNNRVLNLPAGSNTPVELPFTGLHYPSSVAVDSAGTVYVGDSDSVEKDYRVLKLPAGSNTQVDLPVGSVHPGGVAVDSAGSLYVTDDLNRRVLKLAAGSNTPVELPFTALQGPSGVAVDNAGNVYVNDGNRALRLPAGSNTQEELPFTGLDHPYGVAVDSDGAVYVTDFGNRVLKLPVGSNIQVQLPFIGLGTPFGVAVDTAGSVYVTDFGNRVLKLPAH